MAHINMNGKIFFAAVATWLGAKLLSSAAAPARPVRRADPLEGLLPESMLEDLAVLAISDDRRGFEAYLDRARCPHGDLRRRLWRHFGG